MNIAMMTNNYLPYVGGVPISINRLAKSLRGRGHSVDIYAPYYEGVQPEQGVIRFSSVRVKGDTFRMPNVLDKSIDREFSHRSYDVIHTHHPMLAGYSALHMARKYELPLVYTHHTRYEQYLHHVSLLKHMPGGAKAVTRHNRIFTNACDMVFAPSESMRGFLKSNSTRPEVKVLPTGLEQTDFQADEVLAAGIRAIHAPNGERLFCTVSRLEKEKNIPFLLRAFSKYKQMDQTARLLVIGDGSERDNLGQQAAGLGIGRDVVFTGCIDHAEISAWYAASDAFLFASQSETQGIVLLEAMAAGLPVVAVQASGVNDVVRQGLNGFAVPDSEEAFAQALDTVVNCTREAMAQQAAATAAQYTAEHVAKAAEQYYLQTIKERMFKYAYNAV